MKKMIAAGLVLLSFMACQNDELNEAPGGNENGEGAYMSLAIAMPDGRGTRAINPGTDGTEAGTEDEQTISNLLVLLYAENASTNDTPVQVEEYQGSQLKPDKPNTSESVTATTYTLPDFKVNEKGVKKVVVIVNPNDKFPTSSTDSKSLTSTTTLGFMRTEMELSKDDVEKISSPSGDNAYGFMMTNANDLTNQTYDGSDANDKTPMDNGDFYVDGSVYVDVQGTKTNPTTVVIPVERVVAKIMDLTTNYTFNVTDGNNTKVAEVTFESVTLVNGNTKFFPIKNIRPNAQNATTNDYVVDPNFDGEINVGDFYFRKFNLTTTGEANAIDNDDTSASPEEITTKDFVDLSTEEGKRPVFYTLENTMKADLQKTAYTTGLCYKAVYKLNKTTTETAANDEGGDATTEEDLNVFKFGGKLYDFDTLKNEAPGLGLNLGNLTTTSSVADFEAKGVVKYTNGVCYYSYWIKHVPSKTPLDVMKFAVVRNNVYQMEIQSVSGIGTNEPEEPSDKVDDETDNAILQILVKVLPWTVRKNQIEF